MDFKQLETFVAIAKYKTFSKAAEKLFLSQSTVSIHVHGLESSLGVPLFNREGKEVSLTKQGEILLEKAMSIIHLRDMVIHDIESFSTFPKGVINIAASNIPALYILPKLVKSFIKNHQYISFNVRQMDTDAVVNYILNGEGEIGIVGNFREDNNLSFESIVKDSLILIVPSDPEFDNINDDTPLIDIIKYPFVLREEGSATRKVFEDFLTDNGINNKTINVKGTFDSAEGIKEGVKTGIGVSVTSSLSIDSGDQRVIRVVRPKGFPIVRDIYAVTHKKRFLSPLSQTFYNFIRKGNG
jgi:DNA-binding transcriptional LysR family regulator